MAFEVVMPALGTASGPARLVRWLRREGDLVRRDEPLAEVEAEKAVVTIEAPGSGVLSGVRAREGEEVRPGMVLAYLLAPAPRQTSGGLHRSAGERAAMSWQEAPHLFLFREVDASQLIVVRSRQPAEVTMTDLLVRLAAVTLAHHPAVNGGGDEVHLALPADAEEGRLAPVIRGADRLDVAALAACRADLQDRARAGLLRAQDLAGATFTLTDLGALGVDAFLPIVGEGQAAALGAGRVTDRVVPVRGRPVVRPALDVTLSCDRRAVDEVQAARFLQDLAEALEEPGGLV